MRSPKTFSTPLMRQQREASRKAYDAQRLRETETRKLYNTARWREIRADVLASANYLCQICDEQGRLTVATVCDHVDPHRGDVALFWSGPFQALCKPCHDRHKQLRERGSARHRSG